MEVTMAEKDEVLTERPTEMAALYDILNRSKASAGEIISQMLVIKREAPNKSQLRELITQILLGFVTLRQANRSILLEEDRTKKETEHAKAPIELKSIQLQELMYEKLQYVKALTSCKEFKTVYPDIDLVPKEDFFRDAPEAIKTLVLSTDREHDLMLKRLNYELYQRKELCKLRERLDVQRKSLQETIAKRKKFLSSLPFQLKAFKKASLPVQHQLGFVHSEKLKQQQFAELLPHPLYVIYSQLLAQKEAFGENIELDITGSITEAHAFARQLANKDTDVSSDLVDESPNEEERRRKRHRNAPSKENVDQSHPLKVTLHINDEVLDLNSSTLITLNFEYLIKLNVVCVEVEGSEEDTEGNILCNLFPDDTGLELPQQAAKLCVCESHPLDKIQTSRPYKWAQHMAGIDVLPDVSPLVSISKNSQNEGAKHAFISSGLSLYRQQNRLQTVVQRIRAQRKAQLASCLT